MNAAVQQLRMSVLSLDDVEKLGSEPGLHVNAINSAERVHWCNGTYALANGGTPASLRGARFTDLYSAKACAERRPYGQRVALEGVTLRIVQLWHGRRVMTVLRPYEDAVSHERGVAVVHRTLVDPAPAEDPGVDVLTVGIAGALGDLTRREMEILYLVGTGLSNEEVAHAVYRSAKTVANQMSTLLCKLGMKSRTQLARFAIERGLIGFERSQWMQMVARRAAG